MRHLIKYNEAKYSNGFTFKDTSTGMDVRINGDMMSKYLDDYFLELTDKLDDENFDKVTPVLNGDYISIQYRIFFDIDVNLSTSTIDNVISFLTDVKSIIQRLTNNHINVKYDYSNGSGIHIFDMSINLSFLKFDKNGNII